MMQALRTHKVLAHGLDQLKLGQLRVHWKLVMVTVPLERPHLQLAKVDGLEGWKEGVR